MFNQAIVVFLKEIKCLVRDKKTFIFGLLLPLILVPAMLFTVDFSMKSSRKQISDNINIGISDKDNSFYKFCEVQDKITIVEVSDVQQALNSGVISVYIAIGENFDQKILDDKELDVDVKYNESSINSMMAIPIFAEYVQNYQSLVMDYSYNSVEDLKARVAITVEISQNAEESPLDTSSLYFNMLVPMMLILYCCMGSSGTACELSAGEKEHGTLEPLLSTGAARTALVLGKLLTTTAMGAVSGVFTVIGLWGYLLISSGLGAVKVTNIGMIALIFATLFISMVFAGINLTIGVYAKSYKEAQTYLMPISVICIIPAFFTYTLDSGNIGAFELCTPILNFICIIKEIFSGIINWFHFAVVLLWMLFYVAVTLFISLRLFKKESIIFRV